jgi:hypothetical protein
LKELAATAMKKKGSLMTYWAKHSSLNGVVKQESTSSSVADTSTASSQDDSPSEAKESDLVAESQLPTASKVRVASAQVHLQSQFDLVNSELAGLYERHRQGLMTEDQEKTFDQAKKTKSEVEKKLKRKKDDQKRSKKARDIKKKKFVAVVTESRATHSVKDKK